MASQLAAVALNPFAANVHASLGALLFAMGDVRAGDAAEAFERAFILRPTLASNSNNLGAALQVIGRISEARFYFSRAAELNPEDGVARSNLAALSRPPRVGH